MSTEPLIAVIDDDESFRIALVEALCSLGYGARSFASAEEFVAAGDASRSDCIITDIHMPGMSGIDLRDRLIAHGSRIPIIFITAFPEPTIRRRAQAEGALGLLEKPFAGKTMIELVRKAVVTHSS